MNKLAGKIHIQLVISVFIFNVRHARPVNNDKSQISAAGILANAINFLRFTPPSLAISCQVQLSKLAATMNKATKKFGTPVESKISDQRAGDSNF